MAKKRVSFMARGKRVTFYAKSTSKRRIPAHKKSSRSSSRRNYKIRRDTERFVDAGLALIHPAAPAVVAGARLVKDIFDT